MSITIAIILIYGCKQESWVIPMAINVDVSMGNEQSSFKLRRHHENTDVFIINLDTTNFIS